LEQLSDDRSKKFGRGFSPDNLEAMRRFYLTYKAEIPRQRRGNFRYLASLDLKECSYGTN